jgi:tetratricopeptide (TPR) repeat protein
MTNADAKTMLGDLQRKAENGRVTMSSTKAVELAGKLYTDGRFRDAELVCRQLLQQSPNQPDAHNILGVALSAQGNGKEAISLLKKAIKLAPRSASYHANLGEVERQRGNLTNARFALQKAVELDPRNAQAFNSLGIIQFDGKNFEDAAKNYRKALEINPAFAEGHNNLGNVLRRLEDREGAIKAYENALIYREFYPDAYNNLGTLMRDEGKAPEAEHAFKKAIDQNPRDVRSHNNLASLYSSEHKEIEALRILSDALKHEPRNPDSLILTARIQLNRANYTAAEQACRMVIEDDANNSEALTVLGHVLHETDRYDEAISVLELALEKNPEFGEARNFYGVTLKSVGRLSEAREQILLGIELNSQMLGAYANLHDLVDFSKEKDLFKKIEDLMAAAPDQKALHMIPLHFAYAKALDDHGEHSRALDHYLIGGRLKRSELQYNEQETFDLFAKIKQSFQVNIFLNRPFQGNTNDRPVFIVGMPRSGSTLIEQIMSSHPDIYGAGEVKFLSRGMAVLRDRFPLLPRYPEMIEKLGPAQYEILAQYYLNDLLGPAGNSRRVTDKLLTNYFFVGLINLIFPNAKIINTRRNPIDTCLSAFTKLFKDDMPHSYDLGELGRYHRQYSSLMDHWEKVLPPGAMATVNYEDVVADTETAARNLIDFLGLPWNDSCLEFHKSDRPVKTASVAQVRRPIYKSAVERWRKYGSGLEPLVDALAD